jgi:hypothetical protein
MQPNAVERSPKEAGRLVGKHPETVRELARRRRIEARRDPLALGRKRKTWLVLVVPAPVAATGWALVPRSRTTGAAR